MKTANAMERAGSILLYCHHSIIIALGVFGMIEEPSPAVAAVIGGEIATTIWSLLFVVFGLAALGCRIANRVLAWLDTTRSEALCIAFIGFAMMMFGSFIAWSTTITHISGSWQTALALISTSMFLPGVAAISLATTRRERLQQPLRTQVMLEGIADQLRSTTPNPPRAD